MHNPRNMFVTSWDVTALSWSQFSNPSQCSQPMSQLSGVMRRSVDLSSVSTQVSYSRPRSGWHQLSPLTSFVSTNTSTSQQNWQPHCLPPGNALSGPKYQNEFIKSQESVLSALSEEGQCRLGKVLIFSWTTLNWCHEAYLQPHVQFVIQDDLLLILKPIGPHSFSFHHLSSVHCSWKTAITTLHLEFWSKF